MIDNCPLDGTDLLDTDRDDGNFAEIGRVYYHYTAGLQHLEIRYTALLIAIPTLLFIPYDVASSGMDALDRLALQHRTVTRHMEAMIIKHIEDDMHRISSGEYIAISTIAEQVQPIGDRCRFDRRKGYFAVTRSDKLTIGRFTIYD